MLGSLGLPEILAILAVVLLLFGAKKIPELARGLGQGLKVFKHEVKESDSPESKDNSSQAKS